MILKLKNREVQIDRFHVFILAISLVKIFLMCVCTSDYQEKMFIPFLTHFVVGGGNPYQYFFEAGNTRAFPYPAAMLLIESAGAGIVHLIESASPWLLNFFYKLPSLLFDYIGLYWLVKMFPDRRKYAAVFYFSSPIVIYAVYMHGQLDLIPTALLLGAVYCLSSKGKRRHLKGTLLLACAILSKLHILAVLPVVFLYLHKRDGIWQAARVISVSLGLVFLGVLPFMSEGFQKIVLFNAEQEILTKVSFQMASAEVYIPIAAVLIVYLVTYSINTINRDLFVNLCGIVFIVLLAVCPPMPGWYVWIVPYVTLFFANINKAKYKNMAIYIFLNALYLLYFIFLHSRKVVDLYLFGMDMSFIKVENKLFSNILFTLLAGTLFYIIFSMYRLGVLDSIFYKRRNVPFTIGVAGDSGVGKSTFMGIIREALGGKNVLFIEGDGDHRWERGDSRWQENTHLNPKANYLYRQASDLLYLRFGMPVRRVEYDHGTGTFTEERRIKPNRYIVISGLHSLYLPQMRKNLDLKIYMEVDETLRRYWKIQRDTTSRGYSKEKILEQIEGRMPDAVKYIYPQKDYADMTIQYYDKTLKSCMEENHEMKLSIRIIISAAVNIEPLTDELAKNGLNVLYDYGEDLQTQTVDLDGAMLENSTLPIEAIAGRVIPGLEEITPESLDSRDVVDGILKLFVLLLVSDKLRGEI